jgi:hypothetical protein
MELQQPQRRGPVPPPCAFVAPGLVSTFRGLQSPRSSPSHLARKPSQWPLAHLEIHLHLHYSKRPTKTQRKGPITPGGMGGYGDVEHTIGWRLAELDHC